MKNLPQKFVVLEGLDGAGTTTQMNLLEKYCRDNTIPCWSTYEPSNGFIGKAARAVLEKRESVHPLTLAQLFAADRREHLAEIEKHLSAGEWVICDRYLYSSLAYQSLDIPFETVLDLNADFPEPDYCLYLECSIETSSQRRGGRGSQDIYEKEKLQKVVAENYERAFSTLPDTRILHRIDGEQNLNMVHQNILNLLGI